MTLELKEIDFTKLNGLVPAIIQNFLTGEVLMLGFMNQEAFKLSQETNFVHFFSRTKNRIWKKGETSKNTLEIKSIDIDCDQDTLLIRVIPKGPTCHTGNKSCFNKRQSFISDLLAIIKERKDSPNSDSYTSSLYTKGIKKIAQKVGEEGVEVAIAGLTEDDSALINESADLIFHLLVLLEERKIDYNEVLKKLLERNAEK